MIKSEDKKESRKIAKSLNIKVDKRNKALRFTQDGDTKIAVLEAKEASQSIVMRIRKKPDQAHNLKWVRDTERNKRILVGYLMNRIVFEILGRKISFAYIPCCNTFSICRPKEEQGHKQVTRDCLLLLLGQQGKSEVKAYKKQERQKKSLSYNEFLKLFRPKLRTYLKDKSPHEWMGKFIDSLPQRDGCFQFPLIKKKPFETCPGSCPLLKSEKRLGFKVDLVTGNSDFLQRKSRSPSILSSKEKQKSTKSSKKNRKKLKIDFRSEKKEHPYLPTRCLRRQGISNPANHVSPTTQKGSQKKISCFDPNPATQANFTLWSEQTSSHLGPLFPEDVFSLSNYLFDTSHERAENRFEDSYDKGVEEWLHQGDTPFKKTLISGQSSPLHKDSKFLESDLEGEDEKHEELQLSDLMLQKDFLKQEIKKAEEVIQEKKEVISKAQKKIGMIKEQAKEILQKELEEGWKKSPSSCRKRSKKE